MSQAKLAEELKRLLPDEREKRIRQAILRAAGFATGVSNTAIRSLERSLEEPTGVLNPGTVVFTSDTQAVLDQWAWKINFQIVQPGPVTVPVDAPHPTFSRVDYFHGRITIVGGSPVGSIHYTPGQLDAVGNNTFPNIPEGDLILAKVQRNPDGSSEDPEVPETTPLLNFSENDVIPLARNSRLENSGIRALRNAEGEITSYIVQVPVKGLPATNPDEFVTFSQLPQLQQYGRLSGGDLQWTGVGLRYNVSAVIYALQGIKSAPSGEITLDPAHPTLGRFDIYGWNINQQLFYRAGTPSENPIIPTIDPATEVIGTPIFVPAGIVTPPDVVNVVIYEERNAGEWTPSYIGSGTANFTSTANPKSGTRSIEVSNMTNGSTLTLMAAAPFNFSDFETIGFDIALKGQLQAGHVLRISFINAANQAVSNAVGLTLDTTLQYQFVGLNIDSFSQFAQQAQGISISFARSRGASTHPGYYLDNARLQGGVPQPEQPQQGISIHNQLEQIQGGSQDERYHLTKAQWDAVVNSESPSESNPFATVSQLIEQLSAEEIRGLLQTLTDDDRLDASAIKNLPNTGIPEAPVDSKIYGRKDEEWVEVIAGSSGPDLNVIDLGDLSGSFTIDLSQGKRFRFRLTANGTINHENAVIGEDYIFEILRESNNVLSWQAGKYRFPLGYTPILTNTVTNGTNPQRAIDIITGVCLIENRLDIVITPDMRLN